MAKTSSNLRRAKSSSWLMSSTCLAIPYANKTTKPQWKALASLLYWTPTSKTFLGYIIFLSNLLVDKYHLGDQRANMSNSFQELTNDFIKRVEALQVRKRNRNPKAQQSFEHAIRTIITDLWKATHCIPLRVAWSTKEVVITLNPKDTVILFSRTTKQWLPLMAY